MLPSNILRALRRPFDKLHTFFGFSKTFQLDIDKDVYNGELKPFAEIKGYDTLVAATILVQVVGAEVERSQVPSTPTMTGAVVWKETSEGDREEDQVIGDDEVYDAS